MVQEFPRSRPEISLGRNYCFEGESFSPACFWAARCLAQRALADREVATRPSSVILRLAFAERHFLLGTPGESIMVSSLRIRSATSPSLEVSRCLSRSSSPSAVFNVCCQAIGAPKEGLLVRGENHTAAEEVSPAFASRSRALQS